VAVSNTTADEIREKIPTASSKVEVVVNAVNTKFYTPHNKQLQDQVKAKYGLTDFVLFVSNIEPRKNVLTLINAYKRSIGKADTQLFIVGGGGWLNEPILEAIEYARREGFNVIKNKSFVPDEDLPLLMQAARTLVIPSWHEGFGLPLLQAVASGGSVIASDIPALREAAALVRNKNVSFFNPEDTEELAVKLSGTKPEGVQPVAKSIEIREWTDAARELMTLVDTVEVGKK
jgi:alpha-1,3-rhamnosyl/mannosyltransferase